MFPGKYKKTTNESKKGKFNFVFNAKEWPNLEESLQTISSEIATISSPQEANSDSKLNELCEIRDDNYILFRRKDLNANKKATILQIEYETKVKIAEIRLQKLQLKEDLLQMKLAYQKAMIEELDKDDVEEAGTSKADDKSEKETEFESTGILFGPTTSTDNKKTNNK